MAAPNAKIIFLDPNLKARTYFSKRTRHCTDDFSKIDWSNFPKESTLCFFDDHAECFKRIKQCYQFGFKHVIFDDNIPVKPGEVGHNPSDRASLKSVLYTDSRDSRFLRKILNIHYEFPPISPNFKKTDYKQNYNYKGYRNIISKALYKRLKDKELKIFFDEAYNYNWLCYCRLSEEANTAPGDEIEPIF